jgi:hypothetical protein
MQIRIQNTGKGAGAGTGMRYYLIFSLRVYWQQQQKMVPVRCQILFSPTGNE